MKFGIRSAVDVVFKTTRAYSGIGNDMLLGREWAQGEPVLYFDSLKAATTEGTAETVYAQGGAGNPRLIAWEGDKDVTFTFEDALISSESLAILAGADLKRANEDEKMRFHKKAVLSATVSTGSIEVDMASQITSSEELLKEDVFGFIVDETGEIVERLGAAAEDIAESKVVFTSDKAVDDTQVMVLVDYYVLRSTGIEEIVIDAEQFAGYFYIEGDTLFRRQSDGKDLPAQIIIPNAKIQTAFELSMSPEGDPSTFTFTADAFPGTIKGDATGKDKMYAMRVITEE